jgi:hypothetical protein
MSNATPYSAIFTCISYEPGLALISFPLVRRRVYWRAYSINSFENYILRSIRPSFYRLLELDPNDSNLKASMTEAIVKIVVLKDYAS